jgi:hypothetical protein
MPATPFVAEGVTVRFSAEATALGDDAKGKGGISVAR